MKRTVSAVQARQRLGEILESVYYRGDEVVIERAGKTMAVVIPAGRYEAMQQARQRAWDRAWELVERAQERNRDVPYEVIEREVNEAIREVRAAPKSKKSS